MSTMAQHTTMYEQNSQNMRNCSPSVSININNIVIWARRLNSSILPTKKQTSVDVEQFNLLLITAAKCFNKQIALNWKKS